MLADAPLPPPTVLVVSETAAYHHASIPAAQRFLRSLPALHVVVLARVAQLTPARLRDARAVVFASTSGSPPFSATGRRALLRFVREGGAFVGLHAAGATYPHWAGYGRLIGTRFKGHAPYGQTGVVVTDRGDPITRGLPQRFVTRDESYRFTARPRAHVLLAADAPGRPPLAWTRSYGRGRVFYDALGHPIGAWSDPLRDGIVARGLAWAVGR